MSCMYHIMFLLINSIYVSVQSIYYRKYVCVMCVCGDSENKRLKRQSLDRVSCEGSRARWRSEEALETEGLEPTEGGKG